ncbi:3-hydroxybenzoate 6-hydroxylase 1 [Neofusicoccum parvum]|uniref:3-hydroxybenzoate 6-hydroxylase 1 n=3 Tax=Neofusicoccum parvum TaxID=310453 RepID=A0ACB5SD75_9PEZI|nr:3-hydroxybenzoate 6-hydroxylase 1 [Neofusicoccum parvum]
MAAPKSSFRHSKNAGLVDSASHILHEGKLNTTYPTRSLQFLEHATSADDPIPPPPATCPLDILVVGAGIGGLAAATALRLRGHAVAVVEQAPELAEVGAGVQVPPNATRLLRRWGVAPLLAPRCVRPEASVFRRWADSSAVGRVGLMPAVGEWFGAPYWVVHRADYQRALYERAVGLGVEVVFGQRVVGIDEARGAVRVEGGGEWVADLVVAADGIHSEGRKAVLKDRDQPPVLTGLAAYRATIPAEKIKEDPDTAWMLDRYIQNGWLGDARHVVTYTIAGGEAVNVVLIHPEPSDPSTWKQETAISDMKREFEGWDHRVTKLINLIDKTLKWPLMAGQALDHWVSESSRVVIMGDAAHAMLPFMSQGAAQAVEDGGSLATLVSSISSRSELPTALRIFEQLRIPRTAQMQQASFVNGRIFHFRDGPEQRARDAAMRDEVEHKHYLQSPNGLSDPTTQIWCYGHDAEEEARKAWEREMETSARL